MRLVLQKEKHWPDEHYSRKKEKNIPGVRHAMHLELPCHLPSHPFSLPSAASVIGWIWSAGSYLQIIISGKNKNKGKKHTWRHNASWTPLPPAISPFSLPSAAPIIVSNGNGVWDALCLVYPLLPLSLGSAGSTCKSLLAEKIKTKEKNIPRVWDALHLV